MASAIVGQGGVEINTDTIPAGYWLASDAALASSFLGSGQGVLSAMMNYSRQEGKYPIADALLLKMQSEDMSEVLGSLSTVLFRGPEETVRQAAYLQLLTTSPAAWETITTGLGSTDTATLYALIDEALTNDDIYLRQVLLSVADAHPEEFYPWLAAATSDSVVLWSDWSGQWDYAGLLQRVLQDYGPAVAQTQADANGSLKHQEGFYPFASSWSDSYTLLGGADFGLLLYYNDPVKYITMYLDNGWPLDSVHEAVGKTPLFDFRSMARSVHVDPDAELPDIAYPAPAPLLYQTMRLASHHIYGSSRLGVNGYWSKQYNAVWDYREASRKTDTVRLLGRLPWYTNSLNSHVEAYAVAPWGNTQGLPSLAQHYLGQIQYELTNHLGNVQATVSDKKLAILDGDGYRRAFHASLPAAYDYYPFGMLMKERTSMDTAEHPSYMSAVVSVPIKIGGVVTLSSGNTGAAYGATLSYAGGGAVMTGTNGELGIVISGLTPGLPAEVELSISALADVAQLSAWDSTGTIMLGSKAVTSNGPWDLTFTPTEGTVVVKVGLFPYLPVAGQLVRLQNVRWEQQVGVDYRTQLVRVGTQTGDRYEFGFNGQMKTNEVAGTGNHTTALFWEYDPRLGRRWNTDPVTFPNLSPYVTNYNNPISFYDILGDSAYNGYADQLTSATASLEAASNNLKKFNKGDKGYKGALEQFQFAQKIFNTVNGNHSYVQTQMNNLYQYDREDYDAANNATDGFGDRVDIYFYKKSTTARELQNFRATGKLLEGYTDVVGLPKGKMDITYQNSTETKTVYRVGSKSLNLQPGKIAIHLKDTGEPETIAHEVGHAVYLIKNIGDYLKWLSTHGNESDRSIGHHGNRGADVNPSGNAAQEAENRFKTNYYKR